MWRMWKIYTPTNLPAQYNQSLKASLRKLQVVLTADFKFKTCCFRLRKQCTDLRTDCLLDGHQPCKSTLYKLPNVTCLHYIFTTNHDKGFLYSSFLSLLLSWRQVKRSKSVACWHSLKNKPMNDCDWLISRGELLSKQTHGDHEGLYSYSRY